MNKKINIISLVILSALFMFPPFFIFQKMAIILFFFVLWFISAVSIDNKFLNVSLPYILFLLFFIVLDYLAAVISNNPSEKLLGLNKAPTFACFFLFLFYRDKLQMLKIALSLLLIMVSVGVVTTTIGNIRYPSASRMLTNSIGYYQDVRSFYRSMGIGGYDFIYMLVFLVYPLSLLARYKSFNRMVILTLIGMSFVCIVLGAFMIGILISVGFVVMSLVDVSKIRIRNIIIGGIFVLVIINPVLDVLAYVGETYGINALILHSEELATGTYTQQEADYNRFNIYYNSLLNWLDHPIAGALEGGVRPTRYSGHSELFGFLEKFGFVAIVYFSFLYKVYKTSRASFITSSFRHGFKIVYLVVVVFMAINRFDNFYALGFTFFFFIQVLMLKAERTSLGLQ